MDDNYDTLHVRELADKLRLAEKHIAKQDGIIKRLTDKLERVTRNANDALRSKS